MAKRTSLLHSENTYMHVIKILIISVTLATFPSFAVYAQMVNRVVAVVNEEIITQQDINQLLAVLYAQHVQSYKGDELLQKMEGLKKDILKQMIEDKLILSRAKELGVRVREEEVDSKLEYVKSGFSSEEAFYNMLKTQGITIANLKDRYKDQIRMKKLVDFETKSKASILPSEISEYYEKHREEFMQEENRKVKHILIKAKGEVSFELARVEVTRVYASLKEGVDFAKLAREHSHGPNRVEGGDMGYIGRGEMLDELDRAIFSLNLGEYSEPIKSDIGYHIFKVEDIKNSGYFSLEDVHPVIKKILFQDKFKKKLNEWLEELRQEAYIDIK